MSAGSPDPGTHEERRERRVEAHASNPRSKAADFAATQKMTADEYMEFKMAKAEPFDEGSDLFSRHTRRAS